MTSIVHDGLESLHPTLPGLRATARQASATLGVWRQRSRERRELARMTALDLHDIGLTRLDVVVETQKPFWRA